MDTTGSILHIPPPAEGMVYSIPEAVNILYQLKQTGARSLRMVIARWRSNKQIGLNKTALFKRVQDVETAVLQGYSMQQGLTEPPKKSPEQLRRHRVVVRMRKLKLYRDVLRTVRDKRGGVALGKPCLVRVEQMLQAIHLWSPRDGCAPASYASALMSVFKDSQHFTALLRDALHFRRRQHRYYMKSLKSEQVDVHSMDDISEINDADCISEHDIAILVRRPYAKECVDPSSCKLHELRYCLLVFMRSYFSTGTKPDHPVLHRRSYYGKQAAGSTLQSKLFKGPVKVLFIETKGSTGLDYHQAVGGAVMHPPEVITRGDAMQTVGRWPEHIISEARDLLHRSRAMHFRAFPLSDKRLFASPVPVQVPAGSVNWVRNFKQRESIKGE